MEIILAALRAGAADPAAAEAYAVLRRRLPPDEADLLAPGTEFDEETLAAARAVLRVAGPRYTLGIHGAEGVQVGDHNLQILLTLPPLSPAA